MGPLEQTAGGSLPPDSGPSARNGELDPDLMALPAPPQGRRLGALALMATVVVLAASLLLSLRHDLAYFVSSTVPVDLGDVAEVDAASAPTNRYVRVGGTPMVSLSVRYRQLLTGVRYAVFPLAGQREVLVQVPDGRDGLARHEFAGRLVRLSQLGGRIGSVRGYLESDMDLPISDDTLLLLADESPRSHGWALLLAVLALLVIGVNALLMLRWFRALPA